MFGQGVTAAFNGIVRKLRHARRYEEVARFDFVKMPGG